MKKGGYYYDREADAILIPHFTGEFSVVDCSQYVRMEDLKLDYDEEYIKEVEETFIEFEGELYYDAEYSPRNVDECWELLSDLFDLEYLGGIDW